jgi:hypothetical protein
MEWAPVYHVKGWGKFKRHYGDFCTGADKTECGRVLFMMNTQGSLRGCGATGEESLGSFCFFGVPVCRT